MTQELNKSEKYSKGIDLEQTFIKLIKDSEIAEGIAVKKVTPRLESNEQFSSPTKKKKKKRKQRKTGIVTQEDGLDAD